MLPILDVFTTSTYLEIVNRKFTVGLNDASSAEYKTLSEEIILVVRISVIVNALLDAS